MANFTKGEWKTTQYDSGSQGAFTLAVESPDLLIALCDRGGWESNEERLANAHLIAAAPDMYEALRYFINQLEPWCKLHSDLKIWVKLAHETGEKALAKAEGKNDK